MKTLLGARGAIMWGLTALLSFHVIARWPLGWSLLCAMSAGGFAAVVAAWLESLREQMPRRSSGEACERPSADAPWYRASGFAAWGVKSIVVFGTVLSMTMIAVALSAPYLAFAWVVWIVGDERNLRALCAVLAVLVVVRVSFLWVHWRVRRRARV